MRKTAPCFVKRSVEMEVEAGAGVEHIFAQNRVALRRHGLKAVGEVALVAVGTDGHAAAHGSVEFLGGTAPMFPGVVAKKEIVEFRADGGDDGFPRIGRRPGGLAEIIFEFRFRGSDRSVYLRQ